MRMVARLVVLTLVMSGLPVVGAGLAAPQAVAAAPQPAAAQAPQIDVDINRDSGGAWYTSPTWIAIGAMALVLLIVLVAMAARGSGTTIVRE
jgi:hypothetical protein